MTYAELLDKIEENLSAKLEELRGSKTSDVQRVNAELQMRDAHIWTALRTLAHGLDKI
jgi:hypothetical protein